MQFEGGSDCEERRRMSIAPPSETSSDELSEFRVNPNGIIPLWETDSESVASLATDTDAEEGEEGVEEIMDQAHRPIKRRRSFNRHNERDIPIKEKKLVK